MRVSRQQEAGPDNNLNIFITSSRVSVLFYNSVRGSAGTA